MRTHSVRYALFQPAVSQHRSVIEQQEPRRAHFTHRALRDSNQLKSTRLPMPLRLMATTANLSLIPIVPIRTLVDLHVFQIRTTSTPLRTLGIGRTGSSSSSPDADTDAAWLPLRGFPDIPHLRCVLRKMEEQRVTTWHRSHSSLGNLALVCRAELWSFY